MIAFKFSAEEVKWLFIILSARHQYAEAGVVIYLSSLDDRRMNCIALFKLALLKHIQ